MTKEELQQDQIEWITENAPIGQDCGYPKCCIKWFCIFSPKFIQAFGHKRIIRGLARYCHSAGCVNGKFTGFIPCLKHAIFIRVFKVKLTSLIKNRKKELPPFPYYGNYEQ